MLYTKERLQELYKESRRRHGVIEVENDEFSIKIKGRKLLKYLRNKEQNKENDG